MSKYSEELKLTIVLEHLENHIGVNRLQKKCITGGTEALFQKQGRRSKMPKKSLIPNKPREEWTEQEVTISTGTMSTGSGSLPGSCPNCHKMIRLVVQNGNPVGVKPA